MIISLSVTTEATLSQAVASQIVDPTQHQHQHLHEAYQPQYEPAQQQEGEAHYQAQEKEGRPESFLGGRIDLL